MSSFFEAFLCLQTIWLCIFQAKSIGIKAACKIMVKLTLSSTFTAYFSALKILWWIAAFAKLRTNFWNSTLIWWISAHTFDVFILTKLIGRQRIYAWRRNIGKIDRNKKLLNRDTVTCVLPLLLCVGSC